jgi:hypothetical protein
MAPLPLFHRGNGWRAGKDRRRRRLHLKRRPRRGLHRWHEKARRRELGAGGNRSFGKHVPRSLGNQEGAMNAIIYLVGLVVIIMFILSVIGLR